MKWSKLKSHLKELIATDLQKRIDFHVTSYRDAPDEAGEAWITVDGTKIFGCSRLNYAKAATAEREMPENVALTDAEIAAILAQREIHAPGHLINILHVYLDLPIGEALDSDDPFVKALAMIDRRVGKRTLEKLHLHESEHSLVRAFYKLRIETLQPHVAE
ncbi:MAG: hypothetical protein ABI947_27980 [Chloroflexota bacterium]